MRSLDEIYGVGINGYARAHDTTIEKIIKMIEVDIVLLKENHRRYALRSFHLTDYELDTVTEIRRIIEKKRTHLARLKEFANN
jgi:hypothetical protein